MIDTIEEEEKVSDILIFLYSEWKYSYKKNEGFFKRQIVPKIYSTDFILLSHAIYETLNEFSPQPYIYYEVLWPLASFFSI